ncbi:uncharacterized protein DSM5745_09732 [Aspergillus mulundensis]|uniref:Uncharacterized protein n=1 Tax=Aspergillus mulundensis TaxID=1810919 RepID=A0A3D8QRI9_9EURO|nr:hypothetical protein DSM5745_09732 [Aspergillus mulundensis]RDW64321.1 hypothetical protein DSM5745_09732 [Aspergillus mulundensis]
MANSMRVLVYARVTDIPGLPQKRYLALGDLVARQLLSRNFHASVHPPVYDHVHIPADFDSEQPLERWFIFDLNVRKALPRSELLQLPHLVYFASRQGDKWIFLKRDNSIERAKSKAASFAWGGRLEQKLFAELRAEYSQDVS